MLTLTDSALTVVKRLLAEAGLKEGGLRIGVEAMSCSGLSYRLGLEANPSPGDRTVEFDGARVFVDADSLPMLDGVKMDFTEGEDGAGFVLDNPNFRSGCAACNSSCDEG